MEIRISCPACGFSFAFNPDSMDEDWLNCPKCDHEMTLEEACKTTLKDYVTDPAFEIVCGTLIAYRGFSRFIELPPSVSVIGGGVRKEDSNEYRYVSDEDVHEGCFENCDIEEIAFTPNLREIDDYAFANCKSLSRLILPEGLTRIGRGAFENCPSLREVQIPTTCLWLGSGCFSGCTNLQKVHFVNQMSEYSELPPMTVDNSFEDGFGHDALLGLNRSSRLATKLNKRAEPYSLKEQSLWLCDGVFRDCESLERIVLPDDMHSISDYCFCGCKSLRDIAIPDSVSSIGDYAFRECESVSSLRLPSFDGQNVFFFGIGSFYGMKSLRSINVPDVATFRPFGWDTDPAFRDCWALSNVVISDEALEIAANDFKDSSYYKTAQKRRLNKKAVKKAEQDMIKVRLNEIWNELIDLRYELGQLGVFDISRKSNLKSRISRLNSEEGNLFRRGLHIDREVEEELRRHCSYFDLVFDEEFCKRDGDYYSATHYYSFSEWYRDNRQR